MLVGVVIVVAAAMTAGAGAGVAGVAAAAVLVLVIVGALAARECDSCERSCLELHGGTSSVGVVLPVVGVVVHAVVPPSFDLCLFHNIRVMF